MGVMAIVRVWLALFLFFPVLLRANGGTAATCAPELVDWPSLNDHSPDVARREPLWGYAIPGLGMNASELPEHAGLFRANNPGVGGAPAPNRPYTLEEMALQHALAIEYLSEAGRIAKDRPFRISGMSMGGMILSILATKYRNRLPARCEFVFLVTSPNLPTAPAIPDALYTRWTTTRPGDPSFYDVLAELLSPDFRTDHGDLVDAYVDYRRRAGTRQHPREFVRQLNAIRGFEGARYFLAVHPTEALFVGGAVDAVFGPKQNALLKMLNPRATHHEVPSLGHLVNMERGDLFAERLPF